MKRKMFAIGLAAVLLLAGCGGGSKTASADQGAASTVESGGQWDMDESWDMAGGDDMLLEGGWSGGASPEMPGTADISPVYQNAGAKLIRRAELDIQTEHFDQSMAALDKMVADCGGYFEEAAVYGGGSRDAYAVRSGNYIVRVPAERFDQFLQSAGSLGYVTSSVRSSEDVGEQYYDTEARLKVQRTKQERLLALLERAESIEDIIVLENALSDVEYQIEQYTSTLDRYDALISFSTFHISLREVVRVTPEVGGNASLGQRMSAGFSASIRGTIQGCQDLLVWISYNLLLIAALAVVAVAAVVGSRRMLRRIQRRKVDGGQNDR